MAAVEEEEIVPGSPWYTKFFEYWRNRNRVGPGKVELPDCDFFIVGPRRTLRVLRPSLKSGWYYENTNDRPESIIDNFFTRWSRRPHSSSNCRCSFRRSSRLSTTEEQIISAELNRIRTSLCEAEGNGRAIEELEKRVSVNLQKLQVPVAEAERNDADDKTDDTGKTDPSSTEDQQEADEQTIKNKIVKDLERYINMLLEEILDDTVKYVAKAEDGLLKETIQLKKKSPRCSLEGLAKATSKRHEGDSPITKKQEAERSSSNEGSFNDINFSFHSNRMENASDKQSEYKNEVYAHGGYVNRAFIGSTSDPDALDFYLRQSMNTEVTLEQMDCVDSGINSVETIEFQPDQEPSLEQSLMRIINEKFGRTTLRTSWEDLSSTGEQEKEKQSTEVRKDSIRGAASGEVIPGNGEHLSNERATERSTGVSGKNDAERSEPQDSRPPENAAGPDISPDNLELEEDPLANLEELEETVNEHSFEKLRLEFKDSDERPSLRAKKVTAMEKLREKFKAGHDASDSKVGKRCWLEKIGSLEVKKEPVTMEMEDYKEKWQDLGEQLTENPDSFVTFRKNRKPMIVFLHGFGSSAEIFEHQLQYFSTLGYPCIAPEMLGHGMSSAPDRSRDYHFSKLLRDLDAVLCHYAFKPGQKCVIVAHNYGCSFATALAGKYESSIHQLVLISGGGPTPLAAPSTESAGHCCLRAVLAPFLMCGLHRDILYSAKGRQHPYCGLESSEQWPSHMKYVLDGMNWPEGDYVFHRRICTPTLLIHGLRDNKVSLVQECQMERTMLKAFLEAIPAAGHSPMTECPEQLNHMIQCFIDLWKNKKW